MKRSQDIELPPLKRHSMATFFERVWRVRRLVATHQNMNAAQIVIDISSSVSNTTFLTLNTSAIHLK